ncbi:MAG: phosphopantetheine-binding protein [Verrucomicrobiota bacterium]
MVPVSQIENDLLDFVRREVFSAQVDATLDTDLVSNGFDSMSLVRVLVFLEQTYGMWIPESEITGDSLQNLRSLAATVARLLNAPK